MKVGELCSNYALELQCKFMTVYQSVTLHVPDENFCGRNLNVGAWSEKTYRVEQKQRGRQAH